MKALRVHQLGMPPTLVADDIPQPELKPGEVLIQVHAAGLNYPDLLLAAGKYQSRPPLPFIPGLEVSGVVAAVAPDAGSGSPAGNGGVGVGQRVMAQLDMGGFAEFVTAPARIVQPIPSSFSDAQAAAFPLVYQTSYFGMAIRAQLKPGETVLIHSAAGGVGLAALQIARALGAGKIIGTTGSPEKMSIIHQQGADAVIDYEKEDLVERVKELTGGKGADVIFDPVGGTLAEKSTKCIAFEGRLILVGFTSGQFSNFVSNHVLLKNYSVVGLHWGVYRKMNPALIDEAYRQLLTWADAGKIKPVVSAVFGFDQAAQAMEFLANRQAVGKVVIAVHPKTPLQPPPVSPKLSAPASSATEASKAHRVLAELSPKIGKEIGLSQWFTMDQSRINQFADATLDHQFIHIDPERAAKESPYQKTIAHGFLSLSLVPHLLEEVLKKNPLFSEKPQLALNYGLDRVRFPTPVVVGSKIRAQVELVSAELKTPTTIQIKQKVTLQVEGETKPACVAELLARFLFSP